MRFAVGLLVLATTARLAVADPSSDPAAPSTGSSVTVDAPVKHRFALAVNEPLGWIGAGAVAVSAYGSLDQHQVIRVNIASWSHERTKEWDLTYDDLRGEGGGLPGSGRYAAASASWMYFARRPYDGFSVDLGAVLRLRDTGDQVDDINGATTTVTSKMIAGSAMLGWSWLGWNRVFASLQVGALMGGEFGSQTAHTTGKMDVTSSVDHFAVEGEAFMRFGVVLN